MADIRLHKIINARDFSGLHTTAGETIRSHAVIRSGSLFKATTKDEKKLKDLGVNLVIDMRTPQERLEKPNQVFEGIEYLFVPLLNDQKAGISREAGASIKGMSKASTSRQHFRDMIPNLEELYPAVAQDDATLDQFSVVLKKIMEWVIEDKGTVLFHCTAGKDRAGIVSMLLLTMLDVPKETIMRDYMRSNRYSNRESYKYLILATLFKFDTKLARLAFHVMHAERRYLEALYRYLESEYGSVLDFIKNRLHISDEELQAFKAKMLQN
ncbi:MAG: tyrosine-protein phosphatase [Clostridia bacterium]|nr:tyrosine-protein phosphatase [Clostridia bacterium]